MKTRLKAVSQTVMTPHLTAMEVARMSAGVGLALGPAGYFFSKVLDIWNHSNPTASGFAIAAVTGATTCGVLGYSAGYLGRAFSNKFLGTAEVEKQDNKTTTAEQTGKNLALVGGGAGAVVGSSMYLFVSIFDIWSRKEPTLAGLALAATAGALTCSSVSYVAGYAGKTFFNYLGNNAEAKPKENVAKKRQ